MKKVIREGVFETNSSSTHSVVFKKKKNDLPDNDASYELHSPFAKTMFLIGLYNHAVRFSPFYEEENGKTVTANDYADWYENVGEFYEQLHCKNLCKKFKNAVIEEYKSMSNITQEQFEKDFNESIFTCDGRCLCRDFFDDDVLNDCTCPFEDFYGIAKEFKLKELVSEEDFNKKAKEYLSSEFKFVLKEFWCGHVLIGEKEIY